jgi:hypothetical protein
MDSVRPMGLAMVEERAMAGDSGVVASSATPETWVSIVGLPPEWTEWPMEGWAELLVGHRSRGAAPQADSVIRQHSSVMAQTRPIRLWPKRAASRWFWQPVP